jgi:glucokinase
VRRVREAAGLPVTLTGEEVAAMVAAGHPQATEIWLKAADALALAFANYATVMDPQRIVIGGGLAEAGDLLLEPIRAALAKYLDPAYPVVVERTRLGAIAGYLGAALNARRRLSLA